MTRADPEIFLDADGANLVQNMELDVSGLTVSQRKEAVSSARKMLGKLRCKNATLVGICTDRFNLVFLEVRRVVTCRRFICPISVIVNIGTTMNSQF